MANVPEAHRVPGRVRSWAFWLRILTPAALVAVPCWVLLEVVPDRVDEPLVPDTLGWRALSVPLAVDIAPNGEGTGRIVLQHPAPERLLAYPEISLLLATLRAHPQLTRGELRLSGTSCAYVTATGASVDDNQYLSFHRNACCGQVQTPSPAQFELELVFRGADRIDIWTYVPPAAAAEGPFFQLTGVPPDAPPDAAGVRPVVRGRVVTPGTGVGLSRVVLLNYMWQVSAVTTWIWLCVSAAGVGLVTGAFLFPWGALDTNSTRTIPRTGAAAACFAGGLALLYAVMTPPLHAPDEADHLLSYASAVGDVRLAGEAEAWARLGHFERIRFHSDERFRSADVGTPYTAAWSSEVFAENTEARSPTTLAVWKMLAPWLRARSASVVLLSIRLFNALLFAVAVAIAAALLTSLPAGAYPQLAILPYLLVPTLPFFAMPVSEFGPLTSFYVVLSASLVAMLFDHPRAHLMGFPLGLACALALATGRGAWPMTMLVAAALAARVTLGSRAGARTGFGNAWVTTGRVPAAVVFWTTFAAGAGCLYLFTNGAFHDQFLQTTQTHAALHWMRRGLERTQHLSWWGLAAVGLAVFAEIGIGLVRDRYRWSWPGRVLAGLAYCAAFALIAELIVSGFVAYPTLDVIQEPNPPGVREYVLQVLTVMSTAFRIGGPDYLLVTTFWSGFGWLDTFPDTVLTSSLVISSGLAGMCLLVYLARTEDSRRLWILLSLAVGLVGVLVVSAAAIRGMERNLHGRYLIGWYLSALGLAWSVAALLPPAKWRIPFASIPRTAWLVTGCGVVHAWCLSVILQRYF